MLPFSTLPQELEEAIQQRLRDTDSSLPLSQLHQAQRAVEKELSHEWGKPIHFEILLNDYYRIPIFNAKNQGVLVLVCLFDPHKLVIFNPNGCCLHASIS